MTIFLSSCFEDTEKTSFNKINQEVNNYIIYKSELVDSWDTTCPKYGDCDEYALCKLRRLYLSGVDKTRLAILVVRDNLAEDYHMVTVIDGSYVLNSSGASGDVSDIHFYSRYEPVYECGLDKTSTSWILGTRTEHKTLTMFPKCAKAMNAILNEETKNDR